MAGCVTQHFGTVVPKKLVESWRSTEDQQQFIGQAEILPTVVAKTTWGGFLKNKLVMFYIDNESARISLIKGSSPVEASQSLLSRNAELDIQLGCRSYYARVPTCCNIADAPSRLEDHELRTAFQSKATAPRLEGHNLAQHCLR